MAAEDVLVGLTVMSCGHCGIGFAMPTSLYDENRKLGKAGPGWYCPNGHSRIFHESNDERAAEKRRQREALAAAERERAAAVEAELRAELARDRAARTCPWPTCDGRLLASERGLRQHMVKAHGAPWAMPQVSADEIGQVLNGQDPAEVVR